MFPLATLAVENKLNRPQAPFYVFLDTLSIHSFFLRVLFFSFSLGSLIVCYRLSPFHPLAEYPGPLICKATKLWGAWVALRGDSHWYVKDLHKRYGPIVRIGKLLGRTLTRHIFNLILIPSLRRSQRAIIH